MQPILRKPRAPKPDDRLLPAEAPGLLAKRPNHVWMIDFTGLRGIARPAFVGAVIDVFSWRVLAIGFQRGEPDGRFAVRLLRRALARHGAPTWLVSDKDRALRNGRVNALLRRHGVRRRYGAVGRKGIDRAHRAVLALARIGVRGTLFLYRPSRAIDVRLRRYARWHNRHRPHQDWGNARPTTSTADDRPALRARSRPSC